MKALPIRQCSVACRASLIGIVFVLAFFFNEPRVYAADTTWYVNPVSAVCTGGTYDQSAATASLGSFPAGYSIRETCVSFVQEGDCSLYYYEICSPPTNDTYNPTGAVASFGASINKTTFAPRERGSIIIIGSLGSYSGSDLANALLFYSLGNPILNAITCFFFSCPVTRQVSGGADVPFKDSYGFTTYPGLPVGDKTGYGFERQYNNICNSDSGQCYSWTGYFSRLWRDQKGSYYATQSFIAPEAPGNYTVDLYGCHEKYYCVTPAPLNFTVSAPPSQAYSVPGSCGQSGIPVSVNCIAAEPVTVDCLPTERAYFQQNPVTRSCLPSNSYNYTATYGRCQPDATCSATPTIDVHF